MKKLFLAALMLIAGMIFIYRVQAQATVVTLDYYYNNEYRISKVTGIKERFHYTWEDTTGTGYSIWGEIFKKQGAKLASLTEAPTAINLSHSNIYIIVDPDTKKETASPHYIEQTQIAVISTWVKNGGVLVLLANDSANVELPHLNLLAKKFGIHFNDDCFNHVIGEQFGMGELVVPANDQIFHTAKKMYMKDIASLTLTSFAKPVFVKNGTVVMGVAHYGKGSVFAVGDPWFYNEYCNGRLPKDYENDKAATDLATWLIKQTHTIH